MSRDEITVVAGLLVKLMGRTLELAKGRLSEENRGDLPRREGVPRGPGEEGLPCIFMEVVLDLWEDFTSPSRCSEGNGVEQVTEFKFAWLC